MHIRFRTVLLCVLMIQLGSLPIVHATTDGSCQAELVDVNSCGGFPPGGGTCGLINYLEDDRDCCAMGARQRVRKEWFDCDGDGLPDCEYDTWYPNDDITCV